MNDAINKAEPSFSSLVQPYNFQQCHGFIISAVDYLLFFCLNDILRLVQGFCLVLGADVVADAECYACAFGNDFALLYFLFCQGFLYY